MDGGSSPSSQQLHVVIFPWLAFGHLLPSLDLAERLASRGHRVSFVSTPRNVARLPPVRPAVAPLVDFVALQLPRVDGLPDGAESTNDIPYEDHAPLWKAYDALAARFSEFLDAAKPDWVLLDLFHCRAAAVAVQHKVPYAVLVWLLASSANNLGGSADGSGRKAPRFETETNTGKMTKQGASGISMAERCRLTLASCKLLAIRSCLELEADAISVMATRMGNGKPFVPLGLLPPSPDGRRGGGGEEHAAVRWLDAQPPTSVVYVALGTEAPLRAEQVRELALGLELAGTRFLWALRKPVGGGVADDAEVLPPEFEERTRGRGLVVAGWVPQIAVLAHGAVAAFLTHCGLSSVFEGLLFGHPLIMLPIVGDQGPNARFMEGREVGVQVPRNEDDGSFDRHGVAAAVRAVTAEQGAEIFRANAGKLQEIVADSECHERYIDGFVQQLKSHTTEV